MKVKLYLHVILYRLINVLYYLCRIVNRINNSIGQDPDSKNLIGVLDIYGFESFKTNRCLTGTLLSVIYQNNLS